MNTERIHACEFKGACETFLDPLVDDLWKGPEGRGCLKQNDQYRAEHCKTYRACGLCRALSGSLGELEMETSDEQGPLMSQLADTRKLQKDALCIGV